MSCETCRVALTDVALGGPVAPEIEAHLAQCESCRTALERERRLVARIDSELVSALDVEPSRELLARVRERVARPARARPGLLGWLATVAALLAPGLTAARFLGWRQGNVSPPARTAVSRPDPPPAPLPQAQASRTETARRARIRVVRTSPPRGEEPDVLVPPEQEALVRRLVERMRARPMEPSMPLVSAGFDPSSLNGVGVAPIALERLRLEPDEVKPLSVQPITIERLSLDTTN